MLKKANIKTLLVSITESGTDRIETQSVGGCLIETDSLMLRYPESENHGTASLLITQGLVDLKRHGQIESRMTFIEKQLIKAHYVTPNGAFDFSVFTHKHQFDLNETGGELHLVYSLLSEGKHITDNELTISWTFTADIAK